jgi:hypothetical protein
VQLGHTIRPIKPSRFDTVGQKITAVDETIIETVHRVANLSWTPVDPCGEARGCPYHGAGVADPRSQEGGAQAGPSERSPRMGAVSVRRDGAGQSRAGLGELRHDRLKPVLRQARCLPHNAATAVPNRIAATAREAPCGFPRASDDGP